jgi:hypothetical protein
MPEKARVIHHKPRKGRLKDRPVAHIITPRRWLGDTVEDCGTGVNQFQLVMVTVANGRSAKRALRFAAVELGCTFSRETEDGKPVPCHEVEYWATYELCGTVAGLDALTQLDFVDSWQLVMSASVGNKAAGGGAEKVKSKSKPSKGKWYGDKSVEHVAGKHITHAQPGYGNQLPHGAACEPKIGE